MARPLRVFHLIESLRPGGAEMLLLTAVQRLDPNKVCSTVGCLFPPLDLKAQFEKAGAPIYHLGLDSRFDWRRGVWGLARLLRDLKIDILHTHLYYANIYGRISGWLARVPLVLTTLHSLDYTYQDTGRLSFKLRKIVDRVTAQCMNTAHVAVSKAVRDDYVRHMPLKDVQVLYNYIDCNLFPGEDGGARRIWREMLGYTEADFVLLNVGRLHAEKGQQYVIQAMEKILPSAPQVKLALVGDGPDDSLLKRLASEKNVAKAILFAGKQSDVKGMLAMADAFILPSHFEGLPIALLEAMAMELPVVASKVGGIPEVIEDGVNGLLVRPRDPGSIAEAVVSLYKEPRLRTMLGFRARKTIEQKFSSTVGVPQLEDLYFRLDRQRTAS